jgi:hypothetical protein
MAERGRPKAELVLTGVERDTLARWATPPKERTGAGLAVSHRARVRHRSHQS